MMPALGGHPGLQASALGFRQLGRRHPNGQAPLARHRICRIERQMQDDLLDAVRVQHHLARKQIVLNHNLDASPDILRQQILDAQQAFIEIHASKLQQARRGKSD